MGKRRRPRVAILALTIVLMAACAAYTYANRYYFRFVPLPLGLADLVNAGSWMLPASQAGALNGNFEFETGDLRTEAGLRTTLNAIQALSPMDALTGMPSYADITFDKWVTEITSKPFFCTDATQLMIIAAWKQGLAAREWHLLWPGWPSGQGHSVVEFFNPRTATWQLVDAQHAAIVRDADGAILDMVGLLRAYREGRARDIAIDYGPYREVMLGGARGGTVESIFFDDRLLDTPVLQLRQATWFATVPRRFGISGHLVIAYPIMVDGWTHDDRVLTSKFAALAALGLGVVALVLGFAVLRPAPAVGRA